jgi:small subunit ribosomal protein S4e
MHTKSIAAGKGKNKVWVKTAKPGAHGGGDVVTLTELVRDVLGHAETAREAGKIIRSGFVLVDGKPRKKAKFGVGLMDVIEIPMVNKFYRMMPGKKGLYPMEIAEKEAGIKLCKILDKTTVKAGKTQLNLHDGTVIIVDKGDYSVNDTIVLTLPERKVKAAVKFKEGNTVLVVNGRHSGETGSIKKSLEGTQSRKPLTTIGDLQTLTEYVFVVGEKEPMIKV